MSDTSRTPDDLDAYLANDSAEERRELAHAEAALDLATLLYEARSARGLSQTAAAERAGLRQQSISRWERAHPNIQLDLLRRYLAALGYTLDLVVRDEATGEELVTSASGGE
ncbi:MAG TPA: helix-turn-helix transcriptional regulator [Ktedonobacterales bacterium]|nr:helix-turn-helix transcriptional regulator [Ktedonobacterales bacterium]